jgi:integrase
MDDVVDVLFHLLAYTGLRRAEIVGLTWADVLPFEGKEIRVVGKARKLRRVPIHPVLLDVLQRRRMRQPAAISVLDISMRTADYRLARLLKRAGVDGGNRPAHAFRKTVASVLAEEGVTPTDIDKILGWSPPTVRERYYTRTSPNLYGAILRLYASDPIDVAPGRSLKLAEAV